MAFFADNFPEQHRAAFQPSGNGFRCPKCHNFTETIIIYKDIIDVKCAPCKILISCYDKNHYVLYLNGSYMSSNRYNLNRDLFGKIGGEISIDIDFSDWDKAINKIKTLEFYG